MLNAVIAVWKSTNRSSALNDVAEATVYARNGEIKMRGEDKILSIVLSLRDRTSFAVVTFVSLVQAGTFTWSKVEKTFEFRRRTG